MGALLAIGWCVIEGLFGLVELVFFVEEIFGVFLACLGGDTPATPSYKQIQTIRRLSGPGRGGRRPRATDATDGRECPPDGNTRPVR